MLFLKYSVEFSVTWIFKKIYLITPGLSCGRYNLVCWPGIKPRPPALGHRLDPWVRKIPWRRKWQPTPVSLSGKSHGQRSMAGYSPCGRRELETTERLSTHSCISLKAPRPNTAALGVKTSTYEFWRDVNIQSITQGTLRVIQIVNTYNFLSRNNNSSQ